MGGFHLAVVICLIASASPSMKALKESEISVWVVSGGRAELPCQPRPKKRDDQPVLVLWYRSSNTLPIYSYDAREGDFSSGVRWADEIAVGKRAYFLAGSNPPALTLEPAHARDEGLYTCRVDYRVSTSTTVLINLTVVVPPGPPVVIWEGREMVGTVGPLMENQLTELTCRSVGGRPPPRLEWWNKETQLPLQYSNSSLDPVTGTRIVKATVSIMAKRELQGDTMKCIAKMPHNEKASDTAKIHPRSASVILNITLSPVEVRILESNSVAVTSGSTVSVVCRALGSHPPAELSWWRDSKSLERHVTHSIDDGGNITTATLTVVVTGDDDGATLTCIGTNPALPLQTLSDETKLVVFYDPIVELSLGTRLEAENIKEGVDVYFECNIRSNPKFHRIEWFHNGKEIFQNVTAGVVISVHSLIIRKVVRTHSGSYTCAATNAQGRTVSDAVLLTVKHAPVCIGYVQEKTRGAARGTVVTAKCQVEAEPSSNLIWSWVRKRTDGSEEALSQEDYVTEGLSSTLTVIPQRREDYGRLLCRATNTIGPQKVPCVVNLVPAGPPDSPTNCTSATIDTEEDQRPTITITCLEGFDGGLPQNFLLEAWQDKVVLANMSSEFPEWAIEGMEPGKPVFLNIVGYNARGRSDPVTMEVQTSSAPQRAAQDLETSVEVPPVVGAALGVVGVILLLLIVGIFVAKRTKNQPQKSTLDKPLDSTSAEGFNPDVVQSIHRRPPSLDVLACVEEHSNDENDPVFTRSEDGLPEGSEECLPLNYRQGPEGIQAQSNDSLVGPHAHKRNQPRPSFDVRQGLTQADVQSDDSGVSESESDNELKLPSDEEKSQTLYRECEGGPLYHAVPTDGVQSPQKTTPMGMSLESSSCGGDSGCHRPSSSAEVTTTCSSSTELRETPEGCRQHIAKSHEGSPLTIPSREMSFDPFSRKVSQPSLLGMSRRIPPAGEDSIASPAPHPVEVICLPVAPSAAAAAYNILSPGDKPHPYPSKNINPNVHRLSLGSPTLESLDQKKYFNIGRGDLGVPATLFHTDSGELLLLAARRPSDYEIAEEAHLSPSHTSAITTLPKTASRKSKAAAMQGRRREGTESCSSPIKRDSTSALPPIVPKTKGLDVKHVGRRDVYVPPGHPDVCRRESSV